MFAMVSFGVGEIIGGLFIGQIVDRINSKVASLVNAGLVLITAILTMIYLSNPEFTWYIFFVAFLWGV